jgi:hypothetical protein
MLLAACATAPAPPPADGAPPWQQMTRADLEFIHQAIALHHPGPVDDLNPAFRTWFEDGYQQALERIPDVKGFGAYQHVLRLYVQGFADEHLNVNFWLDFRWHQWAGIVLAWNGAAFEVRRAADDTGLTAGAILVNCDGRSAEEIWQANVVPFYARAELPANRFRHAARLLLSNGNPLVERPIRCTFRLDGDLLEHELRWRSASAADLQRELAGSQPAGRAVEVREFGERGAWITLPGFGPEGEAAEAMKATMARLAEYRDARFVVVDVRGNSGGSSYWSEPFVRALYGDGYFEQLRFARRTEREGVYVDHRVSAENVGHFEALRPVIIQQAGEDSEMYRYFTGLVDGMRDALERGESLYRVDAGAEPLPEPAPAEPAFMGRLIYLTDNVCVSACLDFSDVLLALPNVTHVGQPTSADTTYMEVRGAPLPSNIGGLNFATKVYRGLRRGETGYYTPELEFIGDISDTARVEAWLVETVLQDSAAPGPRRPASNGDRPQ